MRFQHESFTRWRLEAELLLERTEFQQWMLRYRRAWMDIVSVVPVSYCSEAIICGIKGHLHNVTYTVYLKCRCERSRFCIVSRTNGASRLEIRKNTNRTLTRRNTSRRWTICLATCYFLSNPDSCVLVGKPKGGRVHPRALEVIESVQNSPKNLPSQKSFWLVDVSASWTDCVWHKLKEA